MLVIYRTGELPDVAMLSPAENDRSSQVRVLRSNNTQEEVRLKEGTDTSRTSLPSTEGREGLSVITTQNCLYLTCGNREYSACGRD